MAAPSFVQTFYNIDENTLVYAFIDIGEFEESGLLSITPSTTFEEFLKSSKQKNIGVFDKIGLASLIVFVTFLERIIGVVICSEPVC